MNRTLMLIVLFGVVTAQGCAGDLQDRRLDEKLATETVKTQADVRTEADHLILSAPGLSDTQRKQLSEIRDSVRAKDDQLRQQSNQLKAVLVQDVLARNYDPDKIAQIKSKIKTVEQERVSVMFNAIREANVSLGRYPSRVREAEQFYDQMMQMQMRWN